MEQKPIILITSLRESSPKGSSFSSVAADSTYLNVLFANGAIPLVVPLGLQKDDLLQIADKAQGFLIPGGIDIYPKRYGVAEIHKKSGGLSFEKTDTLSNKENSSGFSNERDELEISLAHIFIEKKKPILGICRGSQIINVAMGGTLYQDIQSETHTAFHHEYDGKTPLEEYFTRDAHDVIFSENTLLTSIFPEQKGVINSLHHQAIKDVGSGLHVAARSTDGIIEAIESEDMTSQWILGVQWHPEMIIEKHPENKLLFEKFIEAAKNTFSF